MKQLTFVGETATIALKRATEACGEYATVVSTKQIKERTSRSPGVYEVVVVKEDIKETVQRRSEHNSRPKKERDSGELKGMGIIESEELKEIRSQNAFLIQEIEKLNKNMNTIQTVLYNQMNGGQTNGFVVPPEFMGIYNRLLGSKIEEDLVKKIIQTMMKTTTIQNKTSEEKIEHIMNGLLTKMIKVKDTMSLSDKKKLMIFFGPTGVGKTTTMAKIGMGLKESDKNVGVGIVNLDTFRVGAEKQIEEYAKKFNFNAANASKAKELLQIITKKMKKEQVIMIDTAGSGQYDDEKIKAINDFISYNKSMRIEKTLLIPANIKYDDMMEIYESFNGLNIDSVIFTKLDETNSYGNIFTFLYNTKLKVSHFTTGQQVPSDIQSAEKKWFLDKLLSKRILKMKKRS